MATGTQTATIKKTSDNSTLYTVTTPRNTANYPLTTDGAAKLAEDISKGYCRLTVDNGAVIEIGTVPPLVKPNAPISTEVPAFSQKIQAEEATGTGTYSGSIGDGNFRGTYQNPADYLGFTIVGVPISANNYVLSVRYQTNFDTGATGETGTARVIINGGIPIDFTTDGAAGGNRIKVISGVSLLAGTNTIRFEGLFRAYYIDYITVTRQASA